MEEGTETTIVLDHEQPHEKARRRHANNSDSQ